MKPQRRTGGQETEDKLSFEGALEDWRQRTKPGWCTGGQEIEDEAWKAHWIIRDGGRSLEGTLEDCRRWGKPEWRNGGQETEDKASLEGALEDRI